MKRTLLSSPLIGGHNYYIIIKGNFFIMEDRDIILSADDEKLSSLCNIEFFKATGPGGQKRNKTSSAVRVTLRSNEKYTAVDCTERSQHQNRANALLKLRRQIAFNERISPGVAPLHVECSMNHASYSIWLASVVDLLTDNQFDHKVVASIMGISTTSMLKKLHRDAELWSFVNKKRQEAGLVTLVCRS